MSLSVSGYENSDEEQVGGRTERRSKKRMDMNKCEMRLKSTFPELGDNMKKKKEKK